MMPPSRRVQIDGTPFPFVQLHLPSSSSPNFVNFYALQHFVAEYSRNATLGAAWESVVQPPPPPSGKKKVNQARQARNLPP